MPFVTFYLTGKGGEKVERDLYVEYPPSVQDLLCAGWKVTGIVPDECKAQQGAQ